MSPTSKVAGTALVPKGGEDISRLVEARRGKNFFYHRKNSLMRYNVIVEKNLTSTRFNEAEDILSPRYINHEFRTYINTSFAVVTEGYLNLIYNNVILCMRMDI